MTLMLSGNLKEWLNAINVGGQTKCIMDNVKVANVMTKYEQELHDLQDNFF